MKDFSQIKFQGKFRPYQQRVLDSSNKYLKNNKIHIVAAPGSGKTILGLELIKRLNAPCIVLSPTNTIRYQWGDRFESMYLPQDCNVEDFVSYDLNNVKLITSITYQGMHSSINKITCDDEDGNSIDYSKIDMFKLINEFGIKTICVDEAHHLQNEWQKALEIFMKGLPNDIKVIALTATPPYDASEQEWARYIEICGEIDEEIFVTELVKAKNLCPHQDYIYLNYPTEEESLIFKKHRENIKHSLEELKVLTIWDSLPQKILKIHKSDETKIFSHITEYINLFGLLKKLEKPFKEKKLSKLLKVESFPTDNEAIECALNFLLTNETVLNDEEKSTVNTILKKYSLLEKNKASFANNSKIEKKLLTSMGKMESITKIVDCEYKNLGDNLRLLVLTDFIRKQTTTKVGTNQNFNDLSVVSIFETIRRHNTTLKIGALSGSLVILPTSMEADVKLLLGENASKVKSKPLPNTEYSEYEFTLSNKEKVAIVGKLFEDGKITTIVGTKSLLGEGWDSPCINTLIMASFIGSFMLSNQMRGRAIRVFKNDPNKTANIWHLVTLEPEFEEEEKEGTKETPSNKIKEKATKKQESKEGTEKDSEKKDNEETPKVECNEETSSDYKTLKRRFNCFVGPHYTEQAIESGIERISILKNSYTKTTTDAVNSEMELMSTDRASLASRWLVPNSNGIMYMQSTIPYDRTPNGLGIINAIFPTSILAILLILTSLVLPKYITGNLLLALLTIISVGLFGLIVLFVIKIIYLTTPKVFIKYIAKSIKKTLQDNQLLTSNGKIHIKDNKYKKNLQLTAIYDNIKEQKVLLDNIQEFLTPISQPRYVVCKNFFKLNLYKYSYQVPSMLSANKEIAETLIKRLKLLFPCRLLFLKTDNNSKILYNCQKRSYIKPNSMLITQKQTTYTRKNIFARMLDSLKPKKKDNIDKDIKNVADNKILTEQKQQDTKESLDKKQSNKDAKQEK